MFLSFCAIFTSRQDAVAVCPNDLALGSVDLCHFIGFPVLHMDRLFKAAMHVALRVGNGTDRFKDNIVSKSYFFPSLSHSSAITFAAYPDPRYTSIHLLRLGNGG